MQMFIDRIDDGQMRLLLYHTLKLSVLCINTSNFNSYVMASYKKVKTVHFKLDVNRKE